MVSRLNDDVKTFAGSKDTKKHRAFHQIYTSATSRNSKASILDNLTAHDIKVLVQAEEEMSRRGSFTRLWPSKEMADHVQFMTCFNYYDRLLHEWSRISESHEVRCRLLVEKIEALRNSSVPSISSLSALSSIASSSSTLTSSNTSTSIFNTGRKTEPDSFSLNQKLKDRMANLSLMNSTNSSLIGGSASVQRQALFPQQQQRSKAKSTSLLNNQTRPFAVMKTLDFGKAIIDTSSFPTTFLKSPHDINFSQAHRQ
jgi:hypothetical protein